MKLLLNKEQILNLKWVAKAATVPRNGSPNLEFVFITQNADNIIAVATDTFRLHSVILGAKADWLTEPIYIPGHIIAGLANSTKDLTISRGAVEIMSAGGSLSTIALDTEPRDPVLLERILLAMEVKDENKMLGLPLNLEFKRVKDVIGGTKFWDWEVFQPEHPNNEAVILTSKGKLARIQQVKCTDCPELEALLVPKEPNPDDDNASSTQGEPENV